ncbi:glycoside hydrolase family 5 protein [Ramaria rubella]|nr:glycoside hydrolase family 5 protein [Ramaria rubella]
MSSFLQVSGTRVVDGQGREVILRGAGLGGWMNMENFITGYPGREFQVREALVRVLGDAKAAFFFDKFLEYFFTEADAIFFKSLGLNCIRLPFNYRHFEDDMKPRTLKKEGFKHLDRVIDICAKHGIWTILDLHTSPGGQNQGWHSDNPTHFAAFWDHRDFQDRTVWLWEELSKHYRDNSWIAGYNPLNEPADSRHTRLIAFYNRVYTAIRNIDPNHILFLDGNTYAADFSQFGEAHKNWRNTVYAIHDYSGYGFPASPEKYTGSKEQKAKVQQTFERKKQWMADRELPVWNGEWGPVYARKQYDGDATDDVNQARLHVLKDQLQIYDEARLSWSIWLYKDIDGFQGMVYSSPESPYVKLLLNFLAKKQRMAIDTWGTDETHVKHIYGPLEQWIKDNVSEEHQKLYPPHWTVKKRVAELSRHILVAEYLVEEWAELFRGKSEKELDELASSFLFENCVQREELNSSLKHFSPEI